MTQIYSDPERENDPHALPDVEVFFLTEEQSEFLLVIPEAGWYWWSCFPGCLPDSDPSGPFETEQEAIADAQETN